MAIRSRIERLERKHKTGNDTVKGIYFDWGADSPDGKRYQRGDDWLTDNEYSEQIKGDSMGYIKLNWHEESLE